MSYSVDHENKEIYPIKPGQGQAVVEGRYAKNSDGNFYYPKDKFNNEYKAPELGLIKIHGKYVYPMTSIGKPRYCLDGGKEIYEYADDSFIVGVGTDGKGYYARDADGNEYYPDSKTFAKLADGTPYYATGADGKYVYPKDGDGDEHYVTFVDPAIPETVPDRYAKYKNGFEHYPFTVPGEARQAQYFVNNAYASNIDGELYYPVDGFGNEKYRTPTEEDVREYAASGTLSKVLLEKYAQTNDGKVILPTIQSNYYIDPKKKPAIKEENVLGILYREKNIYADYLTNVDSPCRTTHTYQTAYKYKSLITNEIKAVNPVTIGIFGIFSGSRSDDPNRTKKSFFGTWCFWVLAILSLIIKGFTIWWFFLKSRK